MAGYPVIGRFAPSPTGPLHQGSLVAALGSYLVAKAVGGHWYVRMEDLDQVRCRSLYVGEILRQLEGLGLEWDGPVVYQSRRREFYLARLQSLIRDGLAYGCGCTRKDFQGPYPGHCRQGIAEGRDVRAYRLHVEDRSIAFQDGVLGTQQGLAASQGDYVLLRADGFVAYMLACVVDDGAMGVTQVARGADFLPVTPAQIALQETLGLPRPKYWHFPLVMGNDGKKLSKSAGAPPWPVGRAGHGWRHALGFLGWLDEAHPDPDDEVAVWREWAVARAKRIWVKGELSRFSH